jgi:K+-transporting ATPase ATPase C chain
LAIGQVVFPATANGSVVKNGAGEPVGSSLIAQQFSYDEYFQSRPSAASYNASASSSSSLAVSNYALRNRVATMLGPIVTYKSGPKAGQLVAPDIESWFQADRFQGKPSIVAQWADAHNGLAVAWINANEANGPFVLDWMKSHPEVMSDFMKDKPKDYTPNAQNAAVTFFEALSKSSPGKFPSLVYSANQVEGTTTHVELIGQGTDIQSVFFDMWRGDHPDADLSEVPGDMVTTSGSGLDPHITLQNAEFQLDRVARTWAEDTKRSQGEVRNEIEKMLIAHTITPLGGLGGEKIVNVLIVNLELVKMYGPVPQSN